MKKLLPFATILFITILFSSYCNAEFYVVATNKRIGTEIKALPFTIVSPGFYYVTKNLTSAGAGITVESDDVTIDLMGFTLFGPDAGGQAHGISFTSRSNIEIRNGAIKEFSYGINGLTDGHANKVIGVKLIGNHGYGIILKGYNHVVRDCLVINSGAYGIHIPDDGGHIIADNAVYNSFYAGITAGLGSAITGNISNGNQDHGINPGGGCTVANNTVYNNGGSGIVLDDDGNRVTENTVANSTTSNISCAGAYNVIEGNLVTGSPIGIEFGSTGNFFDRNRAANNTTNFANTAGNTDGGNNFSF